MDYEALGKAAYEGYRKYSGGRSLATGSGIPEWEDLARNIQQAWCEAAKGVVAKLEAKKGATA